ncbi:MAG TPA: phytanoyl-CoA dioxygenase family protein [Pseudomonadales bacterium]|nr:phytanoyl-CoA dioxygenase family protein [Pseudomonadales bacterium]
MSYRLSPSELNGYRADGYLVRPSVFSRGELDALRNSVEAAATRAQEMARYGKSYWLDGKRFVDVDHFTIQFEHTPESETIRVIEPVHELDLMLGELVFDERIVEPMRDIIGLESIAIWTNKLNLKRAREGSGFGWHQDSPYWIHDSDHVDLLPNVMVTLDDADLGNGCFQVIRGSHTRGCLPGTTDGSQLGGFFTHPGSFNPEDAVPMELPAGSLVFFDAHSVHGSGPNTSDRARRALVLTYQPAGFPTLKSRQITNVPLMKAPLAEHS